MRVALGCFFLALVANPTNCNPSASPLTLVGSLKSAPVLTWAQIHDGNGAVLISNPSSDTITVKTELRVVPETIEGNSALPIALTESEATIRANEVHRFVVQADAQKVPATGSYLVTLILRDSSGKTEPSQQQFKITVAGLPPILPKVTAYIWRLAPLGSSSPWHSLIVHIPLKHPYETSDPCTILPAALRSDSGDSMTADYRCTPGKMRELAIDDPSATGKYEGDITIGQYPEKTTVDLTIIAKDIILYPILVIVVGTYLAFWVKRYLGVVRIAWGLREQEAELALAYRASSQRFEKIAEGQPFSELSMQTDVERQLKEIRQYGTSLEQRKATAVNPSDPAYLNALADIQSLQSAFAAWPEFAKTLLSLTEAVETVQDEIGQSDFRPDPANDPQAVHAAERLMAQGAVNTAKISALNDQASSLQAVLEDWSNAFKKALALRDAFSQIPENRMTTDDQKTLWKTLQQKFEVLPTQLWEVASAAELTQLAGFGGTLNTIAGQLAQMQPVAPRLKALTTFTDAIKFAPSSSNILSQYTWALPAKASALRLDADPARRVAQVRTAIWRSDWATTVFAGLIGLLTGLNTFYIAKPWGSLGDYLALFLWAAGTKAALDILLGVVDKFAPVLSK